MSSTTPNLGLFKYNTTADANVAFSITKALNNNWDIIDKKCGMIDSKVDTSSLVECQVVINTYINGTSGYRIWSDGYCEQWGYFDCGGTTYNLKTISFLKEFKDVNYQVHTTLYNEDFTGSAGPYYVGVHNKTTSSFQTYFDSNVQRKMWKAIGYIS